MADEKPEVIELKVPDPTPKTPLFWGLTIPTGCVEEDFAAIREQVEFRRKCHNQGFDNLLELLAMTEKNVLAFQKSEKEKPAGS